MIHLILDSTSGVGADFLALHPNVHCISLTIEMGENYVPESEATIKAVIDYSEATKKSVPTSQPSTGDFLKMFSDIPAEDPIIHIKHIHASQMHGRTETHYAFFSLAAFLSA